MTKLTDEEINEIEESADTIRLGLNAHTNYEGYFLAVAHDYHEVLDDIGDLITALRAERKATERLAEEMENYDCPYGVDMEDVPEKMVIAQIWCDLHMGDKDYECTGKTKECWLKWAREET